VVGLGVLVAVEQCVPPGVAVAPVLADDRRHQALPVAEVVLDGPGVRLAGVAGHLPQRRTVDAVLGEEVLGRPDEPVPCLGGAAWHWTPPVFLGPIATAL